MGFTTKPHTRELQPGSSRSIASHETTRDSLSFLDNRHSSSAQLKLLQGISGSPNTTAQRLLQERVDTSTQSLQRVVDEEEQLQGKFETTQRETLEEEEPVQGKLNTAQCTELEEDEPLQGKFATVQRDAIEEEETVQGKFDAVQCAGLEEDEPLQGKMDPTPQKNKTGMPDNLKAGIESLSGFDMSDVRVHRNSDKPAQLNAHAYAQGNNIHLGPGQEQHLPHEAWHVVQQRQGRVKPTMQMAGTQINDDVSLENEADVMGGEALTAGVHQLAKKGEHCTSFGLERSSSHLARGLIQRVPIKYNQMEIMLFNRGRNQHIEMLFKYMSRGKKKYRKVNYLYAHLQGWDNRQVDSSEKSTKSILLGTAKPGATWKEVGKDDAERYEAMQHLSSVVVDYKKGMEAINYVKNYASNPGDGDWFSVVWGNLGLPKIVNCHTFALNTVKKAGAKQSWGAWMKSWVSPRWGLSSDLQKE